LIGGLDNTYVLSDKAFKLTGKLKGGSIGFSFTLKKQDLFAKLTDLGFSKTNNNPALVFPTVIVLDGISYLDQPVINYEVKSNKKGPQSGRGRK